MDVTGEEGCAERTSFDLLFSWYYILELVYESNFRKHLGFDLLASDIDRCAWKRVAHWGGTSHAAEKPTLSPVRTQSKRPSARTLRVGALHLPGISSHPHAPPAP